MNQINYFYGDTLNQTKTVRRQKNLLRVVAQFLTILKDRFDQGTIRAEQIDQKQRKRKEKFLLDNCLYMRGPFL